MVSKNKHFERSSCPIACGLDIVGDHWTLLVIRDMLLLGRHEFKDMLEDDEGISSNILSDRLRKLQADGLVNSIPHPDSQKRKLYYLTSKGKDMIDLIYALGKWTVTYMPGNVDIPEERLALIRQGPEAFRKVIFDQLTAWERQYQIE